MPQPTISEEGLLWLGLSNTAHLFDVCYNARMSSTTVRDIDPQKWRQVKARAAILGMTVGELLNMIIAEWLADQKIMDAEEVGA